MNLKLCLTLGFLSLCLCAAAQENDESGKVKTFEIYGFAMTDAGYNFNQINPNWFDALRITKLPSYKNQFAPDGTFFFGVRQTRFGVQGWIPTTAGPIHAVYEFDMFGTGPDEGQTTMRLRHAYGEWGRWLAGQTNSPFMDGDVWPNSLEYWGPTGMVFFRNVQVRYAAMTGKNEVYIALERPGASADGGTFQSREELDSVVGRLNLPDLSAHYKRSGDWGHVQLAGMLRNIRWQDMHTTGGYDISGHVVGWGLNLSTVINLGSNDVFRGSFVHGEGVENYMQDCPTDLGVVDTQDPSKPFDGKALPVTGYLAFLDHNWNAKFSTAVGYSAVHVENTEDASPNAYKDGQYALINLLYTPVKNVMVGVEGQWGQRTNFSDGFSSQATKIQFSFKYSFSQSFYSNKN